LVDTLLTTDLITGDLDELPVFLRNSLQELLESIPDFQLYQRALSSRADCPLKEPIASLYVEILVICTLAARIANQGSWGGFSCKGEIIDPCP